MRTKKGALLAYSFILSVVGIVLIVGIYWFALSVEVDDQEDTIRGVELAVTADSLIAEWSSNNINLFAKDVDVAKSFQSFVKSKGYEVPDEISYLNCKSNFVHRLFEDSDIACTFFVGGGLTNLVMVDRLVYFPSEEGLKQVRFSYWVRL